MLFVGLLMLAIAVAVAAQAGHAESESSLDERLLLSVQALVAFVCFSPEDSSSTQVVTHTGVVPQLAWWMQPAECGGALANLRARCKPL